MSRAFKSLLAVWIAVALAENAPAAVELVQDGGFEAAAPATYTGAIGDGWSVTSGSILIFDSPNQYSVSPHSGVHCVDMDQAFTLNRVQQTLGTVGGQAYNIAFWLAGDSPNTITVKFGSQTLYSGLGPIAGLTSPANYVPFNFAAFASTASTVLSFESRYTNPGPGIGIVLDDVSVTPIPEPVLTPLLAGAPIAAAVLLRRRRSRYRFA
jgi:hypothetical protein